MYTRALYFGVQVDTNALPPHLVGCLCRVSARDISVNENRVFFKGGMFRFVGNWNVLHPIGFGALTVDAKARCIRYRLSFRQSVLFATSVALLFAGILLAESVPPKVLVILPFAWLWIVGVNFVSGTVRFNRFLSRTIASAPRVHRPPENPMSSV